MSDDEREDDADDPIGDNERRLRALSTAIELLEPLERSNPLITITHETGIITAPFKTLLELDHDSARVLGFDAEITPGQLLDAGHWLSFLHAMVAADQWERYRAQRAPEREGLPLTDE